jgi:predicted DNA-binding protein with PD1-like motif
VLYGAPMLVCESRSGRRIVGSLDRGVTLADALLDVCRERGVRCAEVRGLGSLEAVEVAAYDQERRAWRPSRTFTGDLEIVNLTGNVSERGGKLALHAHVTLMRDRDNGVELLGGHLVTARVFALEFVIDAFDDVILRRGESDRATGLTLWNEAIPLGAAAPAPPAPPPPPAAPPAAPSWGDVAAASARRPPPVEEEEDETDDSLEPGDILHHPTFGRCEVQRIEGSYEFAHVRLRNGRLVRLSLDILKVARAGEEGGQRAFKARID